MLNRIVVTVFCIFITNSLLASSLKDSTGVENFNGKMIIIHKVDAKESYYSIARKYSVSPKIVMDYNANISLQIGSILKVPTDRPFVAPVATQQAGIIQYKVGPKENLNMLAKRFNTTVHDIKELNGLKNNLLGVGQTLLIRQTVQVAASEPAPPAVKEITKPAAVPVTIVQAPRDNTAMANNDSINRLDSETRLKNAATRYGLREQSERGVAVTIDDENVDGTKMLGLHRTAQVGTVVKVTSPMTGKSTFVKVVGKFTENESTKDVIIVISKAAANVIGALDKRFQVNIVYGVPNEF